MSRKVVLTLKTEEFVPIFKCLKHLLEIAEKTSLSTLFVYRVTRNKKILEDFVDARTKSLTLPEDSVLVNFEKSRIELLNKYVDRDENNNPIENKATAEYSVTTHITEFEAEIAALRADERYSNIDALSEEYRKRVIDLNQAEETLELNALSIHDFPLEMSAENLIPLMPIVYED